MPNLDCGAYFLSTLIPVKTGAITDPATGASSSPVHRLRAALAKLPTAQQTPFSKGVSPFAKNTRNHFVRLVVIEDVAYVGRRPIQPLLTVLTELFLPARLHIDPAKAQPQDHLSCPFLLFSADFDAKSDDPGERDSYLKELWETSGPELKEIFGNCFGFDSVVDAESFAAYIARCQITTTMPFHDYFMDGVPIKDKPDSLQPQEGRLPEVSIWRYTAVFAFVAFAAYLLLQTIFPTASHLWWLLYVLLSGVAGLAVVVAVAHQAGGKSLPPAANATLPEVLKALYLRDQFTRFAIDSQALAAGSDEAGAAALQAHFRDFVAAHDPKNVSAPTQAAGTVGAGA
jgi:hypothetical protein